MLIGFLLVQVGILDTDICGPSIPYLLNVEENSGTVTIIHTNLSKSM